MRKKYTSVFLAILLFSLLAQVFIQYSIWIKTDHSHVINLAGRQRMLSQRIASLALQLPSQEASLKLETAFQQMSQTHGWLKNGSKDNNVPVPFTPQLLLGYEELDGILAKYQNHIDCLLDGCETRSETQFAVASLSEVWLPKMDRLVKLSEEYASSQLIILSVVEIVLFLAILAFMAFEIFAVLVPYQKQVAIEKEMMAHTSRLATLGEMSAGIAHEINNPLAVIQTGALAMDFLGLEDPRVKELSDKIKRSVDRVVRIVDALRKFSRKTDTLHVERHKLGDIIREALVITETKAQRHKVLMEMDVNSDLEVFCDEVQIGQVITNLISNAVDANADQEKPWIKIRSAPEDGFVKLEIQDSGPGLPREVAQKVFNPFFTTKPVKKGTGLGLSLSKGLVESNGGHIWYEEVNGHTAFVLTLPTEKIPNDSPDEKVS